MRVGPPEDPLNKQSSHTIDRPLHITPQAYGGGFEIDQGVAPDGFTLWRVPVPVTEQGLVLNLGTNCIKFG